MSSSEKAARGCDDLPFGNLDLLGSVAELSLLPSVAIDDRDPSAQSVDRLHQQLVDILQPLHNMSSVGLTSKPPTLNWNTAASHIECAFSRCCQLMGEQSNEMVQQCSQMLMLLVSKLKSDIDRFQHRLDRLQRSTCRHMASQHVEEYDNLWPHLDLGTRLHVKEDETTDQLLTQSCTQRIWAQTDRRREHDERSMMQHENAVANINAHRVANKKLWSLIRLNADKAMKSRLVSDKKSRNFKLDAQAKHMALEAEKVRKKATSLSVRINICRVKWHAFNEIPVPSSCFIAAQCCHTNAKDSRKNSHPSSKIVYSDFFCLKHVESSSKTSFGKHSVVQPESVDLELSPILVKDFANSSLVLSLQCCHEEQSQRFIAWVRKNSDSSPALKLSSRSTEKISTESTTYKNTHVLHKLLNERHRHAVIKSVVELGRCEFKLDYVRNNSSEGKWQSASHFIGVAWNSRMNATEGRSLPRNKHPKSIFERPELCCENTTSLFNHHHPAGQGNLEVLLMSDKERKKFLDNEANKESMRINKETTIRKKWTLTAATIWLQIYLESPNNTSTDSVPTVSSDVMRLQMCLDSYNDEKDDETVKEFIDLKDEKDNMILVALSHTVQKNRKHHNKNALQSTLMDLPLPVLRSPKTSFS